jgi:integrase
MKRDDAGIRQLGRRCWAIRVERRDERTGRTCNRKATVIGTKADAVARRDELRAELASKARRQRMRLRAFALHWLERRTIKASTRRKYAYSLRHIERRLGSYYVDALAPSDVAQYIAQRLADGAAGNTVLNELRLLRVIAKDSVAEGLADRYWCERVKAPKVTSFGDENPNLLKPQQAELVLRHIPPRWLGLVSFLLTTGCRIGEATALRWEDVDVDAGIARIKRGNFRGEETSVKTDGSNRAVPVLPELVRLWGLRRDRGLVFPTRRGTMHRGSPLRRVLDRACELAGVPRITQHGTRRTFNNEGRQLASREVLKATTGHVTDEMVGHYSHVGASEKLELARAVAARLGAVRPSTVRDADTQGG